MLTFAQVYGRYVADSEPLDDPLYSGSFAAASLTQWIVFGSIALGLAAGARQLLALRLPRRVGRSALIAVGTFLLVLAAGGLLSALGLNPASEQGLVPDEWPPPDQLVFAANIALVVLVGPFVEELLFRGIGFTLLRPFGRAVAVVGSAAAFAAVHGLVEGLRADLRPRARARGDARGERQRPSGVCAPRDVQRDRGDRRSVVFRGN